MNVREVCVRELFDDGVVDALHVLYQLSEFGVRNVTELTLGRAGAGFHVVV
jgi:hypothetical protein